MMNNYVIIPNMYFEKEILSLLGFTKGRRKITCDEKTAEVLYETLKRYKMLDYILNTAYDGAVIVDKEGNITDITESYCKFLGIERDKAIGQHITQVIENTRMHIVLKTGIPEIAEFQQIKGKMALVMRIPLKENNEVIGGFGILMFKSIADLKKIMDKYEKLKNQYSLLDDDMNILIDNNEILNSIIGEDKKIREIKDLIVKVAKTNATVLITGESGTGKELVANSLHYLSPRANGPFVKINCASIPKDLLESELFGYDDGAFTGAKKGGKAGKIELAHMGSLFLDEIGDMPLEMQAKLLRFLQEKEIDKIGSGKVKKIDVRLICATNKNLKEMVKKGFFREDLYYRINVFNIHMPSLKERKKDIPILVNHFISKYGRELGKPIKGIKKEAIEILVNYEWFGNVRELSNIVERAIILTDGDEIDINCLPPDLAHKYDRKSISKKLKETLQEVEKQCIENALLLSNYNIVKASSLLGIHRTKLYTKLKKYKISFRGNLM